MILPRLSIELITKGERTLIEVLRSIEAQDFDDYEVVCVNSSTDPNTSMVISEFGATEIITDVKTKALEARLIAHENSHCDFSLLLDSTRVLTKDALCFVMREYSSRDMVCLREGSLGEGFWIEQASILRQLSENQADRAISNVSAYILPRFYRASLLDRAFDFIRENLSFQLLKEISYGEHHLIFESAYRFSKDITLSNTVLIEHYEDDSLAAIFRKYRWYGLSQRTLNSIPFDSNVKRLTSHLRRAIFRDFTLYTKSIPLNLARSIAFFIGYYVG